MTKNVLYRFSQAVLEPRNSRVDYQNRRITKRMLLSRCVNLAALLIAKG